MSADGDRPSHTEPLNVVVTGGTAGIGLETMKQLVAREGVFRILIGARSIPPSETVESVRSLRSSPRTTIEYLPLDLTSPSSVETFADSVIETLKDGQINILLLCAGMTPGSRRTVELLDSRGTVDETLYVNALSPARLVSRLFATLAQDARIAVVNSGRHLEAPSRYPGISPQTIDIELNAAKWSGGKAYDISKLVEMHLMFILRDKIQGSQNKNISVVSVRPHFIPETNLFRNVPWYGRVILRYLIYYLPFATTVKTGGETTIRAMFDQTLPSGTYVSKNGIEEPAQECQDLQLRRAWASWFEGLGALDISLSTSK